MNLASARYRAFVSYSHKDEAWARWLHRALETYRVPSRLVGRVTHAGPIPRRLFPVFKDRDELPSSAKLATSIAEALRQSSCQIVICSPHAAASRWVNEEIKIFKGLGRDDRILALIVDGSPDASNTPGSGLPECFPPALRFRLAPDGELSPQKAEVVAADARKGKDGRHDAKLKLIAGIIGVGLDELKQRERARRRWTFVARVATAGAVIAMTLGALRSQQHSHAAEQERQRVERLVESGRKELDAGEFARAATFLSAAYAAGERSIDVRYFLARALPSVEAMGFSPLQATAGFTVSQMAYAPDGAHVLIVERADSPRQTKGRFVDLRDGRLVATLDDCPDPSEVAFSAAGTRVLFTGIDSRPDGALVTHIYDLTSGRRLLDVTGRSEAWRGGWQAIAPAPGTDPPMSRLVTLDPEHHPVIWQIGKIESQGRRLDATHRSVTVGFSGDGMQIVAGGEDGTVRLWDAATARLLGSVQVKPAKPTAAFFVGERIATLSENGAINLWDGRTLTWLGTLSGHGSRVIRAQVSVNGRELVTAATNEPVRVWDLETQRTIFVSPQKVEAYNAFDVTADGKNWIATTRDLHAATIFAIDRGVQVGTLEGHTGPLVAVALSPNGRELLSAGSDGVLRHWDSQKLVPTLRRLAAREDNLRGEEAIGLPWADFIDAHRAVAVGTDGALRMGSEQNGLMLATLAHVGPIDSAALSGDRRLVVTGESTGTAHVWPATQQAPVAEFAGGHQSPIKRVAISADGTIAATVDFSRPVVNLWSIATGQRVAALAGHDQLVISVRFFADGRRIVTGSYDGTARTWDVATGEPLLVLKGHTGRVRAAVPSPDGTSVVTVSADQSARLWSATDGRLLRVLDKADVGELESAVFMRDSQRVIIGADNGTVIIWDLRTGESRKLSGIHAGYSDVLALSPDETMIASPRLGSGDLGVWAVESGRLLMQWTDPDRSLLTAAFSDDGNRLLVAGSTTAEVADVPLFDVSLETRTPDQIAAIIRCKSPWKVDGERLLPHAPEAPNCPGLVEAPH